jgi:hypothetical protein
LFVGSYYGGTAAEGKNESESLERVLASAPQVDCGSGREAVLEPVLVEGRTTVRVKCIATARERSLVSTASAVAPASAPQASASVVKKSRSTKESALIIGGSAGAGAGIGAIAKGKKGAALGAAIGGVAGTVYDLMTRNDK